MRLARVLGQVVATVKEPALAGFKLLILERISEADPAMNGGPHYVALDLVGAGEGDVVLVTTGSAARVTEPTAAAPADCAVVAIVDSVIWQGSVTYTSHLQHVTGDSED